MIDYLHPVNPEIRKLKQISENLRKGSVYIFPTDTVYAIIADSRSKEGVESLYRLRKLPKDKPMSLLCKDISMASQMIEYLPNPTYRLMKKIIPGPYTFILKANKNLPKYSVNHHKDRHIGIRFPKHIYLQTLLDIHEAPLTSTSAMTDDEFIIDIDDLENIYGKEVEAIIDGGIVKIELSTILDCTLDTMSVVREGLGIEKILNEL
ncbi:SUA5 family translation factor [Leptospira ryugenii]|uniref:SUA5 family translation factor n=1 Tax=Leptospira ryugenii TaxID=1917863 RepID=A0A2P2E383_9LEPT|nr:L-threonylcarbamoyladenylate synthase [Leptospira ryugenii]GBF51319.1 SUA5 family translation factor [Leptospira ryugenii]